MYRSVFTLHNLVKGAAPPPHWVLQRILRDWLNFNALQNVEVGGAPLHWELHRILIDLLHCSVLHLGGSRTTAFSVL